jgi:Fe-S-cluster containining protein
MGPIGDGQRQALEALYARIDTRASEIAGAHAWWPCRRGCDHCCRTLSAPLPLTELEWRYLWEGFQQLPPEAQVEVRARVKELEQRPDAESFICPLLDRETGACRVYAHRPLVCRSYGFAAARDGGRWCEIISGLLEQHGEDGLMWANQDALIVALDALGGPTSTVFEWFSAHP